MPVPGTLHIYKNDDMQADIPDDLAYDTILEFINQSTVIMGMNMYGHAISFDLNRSYRHEVLDDHSLPAPLGLVEFNARLMTKVNDMLVLHDSCRPDVIFIRGKDIFVRPENSQIPVIPRGLIGHGNYLLTYGPRRGTGWIQLFYIDNQWPPNITEIAALVEPNTRATSAVTSVYWTNTHVYFAVAGDHEVKIWKAMCSKLPGNFEHVNTINCPIIIENVVLLPGNDIIVHSFSQQWTSRNQIISDLEELVLIGRDHGGPIIGEDGKTIKVWCNRDVTSEPDFIFTWEGEAVVTAAISSKFIVVVDHNFNIYFAGLINEFT